MQQQLNYNKRASKTRQGYAVMLSVVTMSVLVLGLMFINYSKASQNLHVAKDSHLRMDYAQKEDAFLKALVQIVPERAKMAMQNQSSTGGKYENMVSWNQIFQEAFDAANAEISQDNLIEALSDSNTISGNAGDTENTGDLLKTIVGYNKAAGTSGITFTIKDQSMPTILQYAQGSQLSLADDMFAPIISHEKGYILESDMQFSLYDSIPYPNIHFGYCKPGEPFVAKRNWWAFSINFADDGTENYKGNTATTGSTQKNYIISLYEVPSQLPISADGFMALGRHANDQAWGDRINIEGGVYARTVEHSGNDTQFDRVAATNSVLITDATKIGDIGEVAGGQHDYENQKANIYGDVEGFYPISRSSSSGRVAFIPINGGYDSIKFNGSSTDSSDNSLSPTTWSDYSRGARQCESRVEIIDVRIDQEKIIIDGVRIKLKKSDGNLKTIFLLDNRHDLVGKNSRHVNWNNEADTLPINRSFNETTQQTVIQLDMSKWKAFVESWDVDLEDNNTIVFDYKTVSNYTAKTLEGDYVLNDEMFDNPTGVTDDGLNNDNTDIALEIIGASDLATDFSSGFSIVSPLRTYFKADFNNTELTNKPGEHPPVSVFSPEPRFGSSEMKDQAPELNNSRINILQANIRSDGAEELTLNPLDLKSASGASYGDQVRANLKPITDPRLVPPIHFVNWLVVVEEVID